LKYQPEIDGLRGLAVVLVILFHAGFAPFAGGFIGVDIFFVISGYLITGIICTDAAHGRFSLVDFYERRIRRIVPALLVTLIGCLLAGFVLFLPNQLTALGNIVFATAGMASNFSFLPNQGYFSKHTALEPLLHGWSLAVEGQFYLLLPLFMWAVIKLRWRPFPVISLIFVASLMLSQMAVGRYPNFAFYMLPARGWELLLGAMLATGPTLSIRSQPVRDLLALAGLSLILVPVFSYDGATPFPGIAALPPCIGTALLLASIANGGGRITRLFANRAVVGIGLISYSLYLVHLPILVFFRQFLTDTILSNAATFAALALSFVTAWLLWRFIELPFRSRTVLSRRVALGGIGGMILALVPLVLVAQTGLPQRFDPQTLRLIAGADDFTVKAQSCVSEHGDGSLCAIGKEGPAVYALWGDSHAAAMMGAFAIAGERSGRAGQLYSYSGCMPSPPPPDQAVNDDCQRHNHNVEQTLVSAAGIDTIFLIAYWRLHLRHKPVQTFAALERTILRLRRAGKRVVLVANLPDPGYDVPWKLAVDHYLGRDLTDSALPQSDDAGLRALAQRTGAGFVDLGTTFCGNGKCAMVRDDAPLFRDKNHVSQTANERLIAPALIAQDLP
jgi:peptidoglycan/LPS O-acetylase OafA/YrhL